MSVTLALHKRDRFYSKTKRRNTQYKNKRNIYDINIIVFQDTY